MPPRWAASETVAGWGWGWHNLLPMGVARRCLERGPRKLRCGYTVATRAGQSSPGRTAGPGACGPSGEPGGAGRGVGVSPRPSVWGG